MSRISDGPSPRGSGAAAVGAATGVGVEEVQAVTKTNRPAAIERAAFIV
jgi:hypothetical protein